MKDPRYQVMKAKILSVLAERGELKLEDLQPACCESPAGVPIFKSMLYACQQMHLVNRDYHMHDNAHPEDDDKEFYSLIDQATREACSLNDECRLRKIRKQLAAQAVQK